MANEFVARKGLISLSTSSFYGPVNFSGSSLVGIGTGSVLFTNASGSVTSSGNLVWDNTNARLGIGTSSPGYTLDIIGNIKANTLIIGTTQAPTIYNSNGSLYHTINSTTYNYIWLRGSEIMRLTGDGNLLLGTTTNSGYRLDVNGSGSASGSFRVSGNISAGAGSATAVTITPTLTATANSDALLALSIVPTFTPGAFTGVGSYFMYASTTVNSMVESAFFNNSSVTSGFQFRFGNSSRQTLLGVNYGASLGSYGLTNVGSLDTYFATLFGGDTWIINRSQNINFAVAGGSRHGQFAQTTGNFILQSGGTFTDANYRLQVNPSTSSGSIQVSGSTNQPAIVGNSLTSVNIVPTMVFTTGSQTQTAFKVMPTFSGSSTFTSSQTNIIADFGATSVGSQLIVTDVTSGSIYMVNDVSGIPIAEATSDWNFLLYDYPYTVFKKTGSVVELGVAGQASSSVLVKSDLVINEGLGFSYRQSQVSASVAGAVTSSLYNLTFTNVSSSVYIQAVVTGYDTGSRDTITGDIKATIRYRAGAATIVGIDQSFVNTDNSVVGFDIVAGGTSGSLVAFGTGSRTYQFGATVTTQII